MLPCETSFFFHQSTEMYITQVNQLTRGDILSKFSTQQKNGSRFVRCRKSCKANEGTKVRRKLPSGKMKPRRSKSPCCIRVQWLQCLFCSWLPPGVFKFGFFQQWIQMPYVRPMFSLYGAHTHTHFRFQLRQGHMGKIFREGLRWEKGRRRCHRSLVPTWKYCFSPRVALCDCVCVWVGVCDSCHRAWWWSSRRINSCKDFWKPLIPAHTHTLSLLELDPDWRSFRSDTHS